MANRFELGITAQSLEKALEGEINPLHGGLQGAMIERSVLLPISLKRHERGLLIKITDGFA
jgi:hypothetical protein